MYIIYFMYHLECFYIAELDVGPNSLTQPDPTYSESDPTQPYPIKNCINRPDSTHFATNSQLAQRPLVLHVSQHHKNYAKDITQDTKLHVRHK